MEGIKNNMAVSNAYMPTNKTFDIEGVITKKDGKNITIETEIEGKKVEFDVRLKEEIVQEVGEKIEVKKEEMVSINAKRGEREEDLTPEAKERIKEVLGQLGLDFNKENVRLVGEYISLGLNPSKMDILSFLQSREALISLQEELDVEMIVKMKLRGIDLERENLVTLSEKKVEIINEGEKKSILKMLGFKKDMTYEEAERVSMKVYGRKMGKDVYDAIIALDKNGIEVDKKSIDKVLEVLSKVKDLKDIDTSIIIRKEEEFTINALYREKNSYVKGDIGHSEKSRIFEEALNIKNSDLEGAKNLLSAIDEEETIENIEIARAFILEDTKLTKEAFSNIKDMRTALERLVKGLKAEAISSLYEEDLLNTDIRDLAKKLDNILDPIEMPDLEEKPQNETIEYTPHKTIDGKFDKTIDIGKLEKIDSRALLELVNSEEDFTLDSLAKILKPDDGAKDIIKEAGKTFESVYRITEMMATIGEEPSSKAIALAYQREERISIKAISDSTTEIQRNPEILIKPVEGAQETFVRTEYLKVRALLRVSVVKASVRENLSLESMEISEMNSYAMRKMQAYEEAMEIRDRLNGLKGRERILFNMMRVNDFDLNLSEALSVSKFLNNDYKELKKDKKVQEIEKEVSDSIKEGAGIKESYIKLLNEFENFSGNNPEAKEDMNMRKKLGRRSTSLNLPIEIGGEMNNLSVFMPKTPDKNMMNLFLSIETKEYGLVNMDLSVTGKNIKLDLEGGGDALFERMPQLRDILQERGYQLLEVER